MLEPSGALAVAGMTKYAQVNPGGCYATITSEANIKFDTLRFIAERPCHPPAHPIPNRRADGRALIGQGHEAIISVQIPEKPGSFHRLYDIIYPRAVTEFAYRFGDRNQAKIYVGISVDNPSSAEAEARVVAARLHPRPLTPQLQRWRKWSRT